MPAITTKHAAPIGLAAPAERFHLMAERFHMMAEPNRAQILMVLGERERPVDVIDAEVGLGSAGLGHHMAILRLAGLIDFRQDRNWRTYRLTDAGREMLELIETLGA